MADNMDKNERTRLMSDKTSKPHYQNDQRTQKSANVKECDFAPQSERLVEHMDVAVNLGRPF